MKTENWNGHQIRFIDKDGEWWAVAKDITDALGFGRAREAIKRMPEKYKGTTKVIVPCEGAKSPTSSTARKSQEMSILNEKGIYRLIMRSNKPEAETFQDWVYDMLKQLRESTGLEGFQVFRMLDKEHQKEMMSKLSRSLKKPVRVNFIKANTVANKAVSLMYGYPKMIKKDEMTPEMLKDREPILEDVVGLMGFNDRFRLDLSVSKQIYQAYAGEKAV